MLNKRNHLSIHIIIVLVLLLSSCLTHRKIEYLQQKSQLENGYPNRGLEDYKLKPKDELYIQISSLDDAASTITSSSNAGRSEMAGISPYGASLIAHKIDKEGYLELPVIGRILVKDKTIGQVTTMIKEALINVLNQPIISVTLVNKYISVLGEVRNPGHFVFSENNLSIFDAIGMAGDITDYGNRQKVILVRNVDGTNYRKELNLLESDLLASEYYYLCPGDIVYVKPLRSKFWGFREFPLGNILTAISTGILVLTYMNTRAK